ncbi:MAG: hypothetical protein EA406_00090 [Rhodospirillales bacterium]|nr:MAG: hypothetical protein EA406_00090 [Rhodospirillales bacterium]
MAIAAFLVGVGAAPAGAIAIVPTNDAFGLANTLFLDLPGLTVNNASLSSAAQDIRSASFQAGTYTNLTGTYGLPLSGIALSTGNVTDYATGPNTDVGFSTDFGVPASDAQNALLTPITGQLDHFDVVQFDIEFFAGPNATRVIFFATFGSEEWPAYVGTDFNDGVGLFVNGVNVAGVLPTGGVAGDPLLPVNIGHPDMSPITGTEINAVLAPNGNPVLRFDVPINPAEMNSFRIILADAGDSSLDTTVYLSSFFSPNGIGNGLGGSEFDPVLPANPADPVTGTWDIQIPDVPAGTTVWIDPLITVGFEYAVLGGPEFLTVTAPSLATIPDLDGYFITVGAATAPLGPGATLNFLETFGLTPILFILSGIDPKLGLDPDDPDAFPIGISLTADSSGTTILVTPSVVPLPPAFALYLGALAFLGALAYRRQRSV